MELLVVLVLMAVLAVFAAPRFIDQGPMRSSVAARRLAADIRYAQRLATWKHIECGLLVTGPTTYRVFEAASGNPATDPLTQGPFEVDIGEDDPGGAIGPMNGSVTFDVRGRPKAGFTGTFTIGARTVTIASETGMARW